MPHDRMPPEPPSEPRNRRAAFLASTLPPISLIADGLALSTLWLQGTGMNGFSLAATSFGGVGFLAAAGYLLASADRHRWQTILATIALLLGLEMALVGLFGWPTDDPPPPPPPPSTGSITFPAANAKVDRCIKVRGKGSPQEGHTWRLGAAPAANQDSNYYLPRNRRVDGDVWSAWPVFIGAEGEYDHEFDVVLYGIPNSVLSKYNSDSDRARPRTLAELKDDGITIVEKVRVSRKDAMTTSNDACSTEPR